MTHDHPIAVIGAGPVGLAAAAQLIRTGQEPVVFEAGESAGAAVLRWGHVRLFSPWRYLIDDAARELLAGTGWTEPDPEAYPTGRELVERCLRPLAETPALRSRIRYGSRVVSVARAGLDKMTSPGRDVAPFLLTVQNGGREELFLARATIDASGTSDRPNPLGASGVPAIGERALTERIAYGIPDLLGRDRARYAGKRVLVVGSGHSAFNVLVDLADEEPGTTIVWAIRRPGDRLHHLFGGGVNDALPARGALGDHVWRLVADGRLRMETSVRLTQLTATSEGIVASGEDIVLPPVDEIIGATGFRPDLGMLSELRLALDPAVESPAALAPLIDPNLHSCGSVPPHGEAELRHPDPGVYIAGMKSYGRAPTFLMLTGYEQVRSIACWLAGDLVGARDVRLILPETGVCSSSILAERGGACCADDAAGESDACSGKPLAKTSACCGEAAPQLLQLTAARKGGCCT